MKPSNVRTPQSITWPPQEMAATRVRYAPFTGAAALSAIPRRPAGRIVVMSLLLASCAYRQDPVGAAVAVAARGEPALADRRDENAPGAMHDMPAHIDRALPSAHTDSNTSLPEPARPKMASAIARAGTSDDIPFLGPMTGMDVVLDNDPSLAISLPAGDAALLATGSPVPSPAAVLLSIGHDDTGGWAWFGRWYALPALLVVGVPLLGMRYRRRHAGGGPRRPPLILGLALPIAAPEKDDNQVDNGTHDQIVSPLTVSWAAGDDPLAREDWSIRIPVAYFPRLSPAAAAIPVHAAEADIVFDELIVPVDATPVVVAKTAAMSPADLLERIEAMASRDGQTAHFFLEEKGYLPVIVHAAHAPLPEDLLRALEHEILASTDPTGELSTWLLVQVQSLRMAMIEKNEVDAMHRAAFAFAMHGWERSDTTTAPHWLARLIAIDLAQASRLGNAARLLALRNMAMRYADDIERGEGPVLEAWIGVLLYWAKHQIGDGALARYEEAANAARRLRGSEEMADQGQLLLAEAMLHRSSVELGGVRAQTLEDAQALLDELFARQPSGRVALAVAHTALARGQHAAPTVAKEAFSHALTHAFVAGSDPRWQEESLQCRLAIQLAYEALPDMPVQGRVALDLAHRLEQTPTPSSDTLERMALAFVRHAEYARACRLCAQSWRATAAGKALLAVWRQASGQWAQRLTTPGERAAWQENERQRRVAGQMH